MKHHEWETWARNNLCENHFFSFNNVYIHYLVWARVIPQVQNLARFPSLRLKSVMELLAPIHQGYSEWDFQLWDKHDCLEITINSRCFHFYCWMQMNQQLNQSLERRATEKGITTEFPTNVTQQRQDSGRDLINGIWYQTWKKRMRRPGQIFQINCVIILGLAGKR